MVPASIGERLARARRSSRRAPHVAAEEAAARLRLAFERDLWQKLPPVFFVPDLLHREVLLQRGAGSGRWVGKKACPAFRRGGRVDEVLGGEVFSGESISSPTSWAEQGGRARRRAMG